MDTIKELLAEVTLFVRTLNAMALELEDQHKRLYALEENRKIKDKTIMEQQKEIASLKLLIRNQVV